MNSNDLTPLDPDFWQAMGITPIVIDSTDSNSVSQGMNAITQAIVNATE